MKTLQTIVVIVGASSLALAIACSHEERPAQPAPEAAGVPSYWESSAPPIENEPSRPMIDERLTPKEQTMPPAGDSFQERRGTTDKFLWEDSPLPSADAGAQTSPPAQEPQRSHDTSTSDAGAFDLDQPTP